jgi:hypothetical protein
MTRYITIILLLLGGACSAGAGVAPGSGDPPDTPAPKAPAEQAPVGAGGANTSTSEPPAVGTMPGYASAGALVPAQPAATDLEGCHVGKACDHYHNTAWLSYAWTGDGCYNLGRVLIPGARPGSSALAYQPGDTVCLWAGPADWYDPPARVFTIASQFEGGGWCRDTPEPGVLRCVWVEDIATCTNWEAWYLPTREEPDPSAYAPRHCD